MVCLLVQDKNFTAMVFTVRIQRKLCRANSLLVIEFNCSNNLCLSPDLRKQLLSNKSFYLSFLMNRLDLESKQSIVNKTEDLIFY